MQVKPLYKYTRDDGGTTVSLDEPDRPYTVLFRVVADEGKLVTDGAIQAPCIDVESTEGWVEIDAPEEEKEEIEE